MSHPCGKDCALRTVGGESRKSRRPFADADSRASASSCCASQKSRTSSKNTNLKGLTSFIVRSAPKNKSAQGKQVSKSARATTSSGNTGDVIVENTSMTIA